MLAGISAGLLSLGSCGNEMFDQINTSEEAEIVRGKEPIFEPVGQIIEPMPSFPGGTAALMKFLSENVKYPEQAEKDSIQGRVVCKFTVGEDGSISDITVAKSVHPLLDAEAVRVFSLMPKWIPGKLNGQPTKVNYTMPIAFRLEKNVDYVKVNNK